LIRNLTSKGHIMHRTKRTVVVAGTTAVLIGGGIAFAAWTTNGTGTGTATATTDTPLTVNVSNVLGLYPTGTFNVPFTVSNTNGYDVTLQKVTLESVSVDGSHSTCATTVVTGADLTDTDVVAKTNGVTASKNFPVTMSNAATDACKGATFTLTLKAWGASS
jgi:hypothetical protein